MRYGSGDQSADFEGEERFPICLASRVHTWPPSAHCVPGRSVGSAEASWEELFAGYTALKAITFSSSLEMIMRMADRLADMEVVFGSESILSKEHLALTQASQTIQSYGFGDALIDQKALVEALSRFLGHAGSKLLERVVAGTLRFRLLRGRPSHEQLYLIQTRRRRSYGSAARPVAAVRQTPSSRQVRLAPDHEP